MDSVNIDNHTLFIGYKKQWNCIEKKEENRSKDQDHNKTTIDYCESNHSVG